MASTYVNDLRLEEIGSGEQSGSWGDTTNTNLELIAEAFSFGTEAITTNADTHTTTIADGATDPGRSLFLKYTGTLDSACTITLAPNTISKLWFIENGTSGSQNIIIKQGSGATITVPPGDTKAIYSNGAGSGAVMVDAFASLSVVDLKVQDDLTVTDDVAIGGLATIGETLAVTGVLTTTAATVFNGGFASNADSTMGTNKKLIFRDAAIHISSTADGDLSIAADDEIDITSTLIDVNGNLDVSGTALVTGVLTTTAQVVQNGGVDSNAASSVTSASTALVVNSGATNVIASFTSTDATGAIKLVDSGGNVEIGAVGSVFTVNPAGGASTLNVAAGSVVVNENSADCDFRVESNGNANMIFVDGGSDHVNIGTATDLGGMLNVAGPAIVSYNSGDLASLTIQDTGTSQAGLNIKAGSGSTNRASRINFFNNVTSTSTPRWAILNDYSQNGGNDFTIVDSAATKFLRLTSNHSDGGVFVINEDSDDVDFRVERDGNAKLFFCDGGTNRVGSGTDAPTASVHLRDVYDSSGADVFFKAQNGLTSRQAGYLVDDENSATVAYLFYDNGSDIVSIGTNAAKEVQIRQAGVERITFKTGGSTVINDSGADLDFRVESDTNEHALFVDASANVLNIGTDNTSNTAGAGHKWHLSATQTTQYIVTNTDAATNYPLGIYNEHATLNGTRLKLQINGGLANFSANDVNLSDERMKENINLLADGALAKICAIPVKTFNYKDEPDGTDVNIGVIAQDVEAVAPELVDHEWGRGNDGVMADPFGDGVPLKSVFSDDIQYTMMKAIQELKTALDVATARITELEG